MRVTWIVGLAASNWLTSVLSAVLRVPDDIASMKLIVTAAGALEAGAEVLGALEAAEVGLVVAPGDELHAEISTAATPRATVVCQRGPRGRPHLGIIRIGNLLCCDALGRRSGHGVPVTPETQLCQRE